MPNKYRASDIMRRSYRYLCLPKNAQSRLRSRTCPATHCPLSVPFETITAANDGSRKYRPWRVSRAVGTTCVFASTNGGLVTPSHVMKPCNRIEHILLKWEPRKGKMKPCVDKNTIERVVPIRDPQNHMKDYSQRPWPISDFSIKLGPDCVCTCMYRKSVIKWRCGVRF